MTGVVGAGAACPDAEDRGVTAAIIAAKWLRFAAAPTFMLMALLTALSERGMPNALCSAMGNSLPGGMAWMYLLMSAFHLAPWLKMVSRRRPVPWHARSELTRDSFSRPRSSWLHSTSGAQR